MCVCNGKKENIISYHGGPGGEDEEGYVLWFVYIVYTCVCVCVCVCNMKCEREIYICDF